MGVRPGTGGAVMTQWLYGGAILSMAAFSIYGIYFLRQALKEMKRAREHDEFLASIDEWSSK